MPVLFSVAFYLASFGMGWLVMMFGWGIEPVSWVWIIGGTVGVILLMGVGQYCADAAKNK